MAISLFGAITLHLPASVGNSDSSRFHICEERNCFSEKTFPKEFKVADFRDEDIMLAFLKLIMFCFIELLTHFLPGLSFLKGVFSLFDSTYYRTISLISCNEGLKPTLHRALIQSANCFSFCSPIAIFCHIPPMFSPLLAF